MGSRKRCDFREADEILTKDIQIDGVEFPTGANVQNRMERQILWTKEMFIYVIEKMVGKSRIADIVNSS